METWITVALCWLLFIATHIGLATSRVRTPLVARFGRWGFAHLYSAVAAVTFGVAMHTFAVHQAEGPAGLGLVRFAAIRWLGVASIGAGVTLSVASFWFTPASALALLIEGSPRQPRGLERITRHPFFVGTALLCLGHVLVASRLVSVMGFGGLAFLSIAGAMHQDTKLCANLGRPYADYLAATSIVPFAAILRGRGRLEWREIPWLGLALGVLATFALRSVHDSILGQGGAWVIGGVVSFAVLAMLQIRIQRNREPRRERAIDGITS
jgi:uncharacterized membrane protein